MKQRRINATLAIAVLVLTIPILTVLPLSGATAPAVASLSTNPKRINESAAAHSFIRSPFVDSSPGTTTRISAAPRLERQPLESLTALNSTDLEAEAAATESGAPLSAFSVPSVASAVQSPGTTRGDFVAKLATFSCDDVTEIPKAECEALVALYNSTDGANWSNNSGWMHTNTPCSWWGVACSPGHVARLELGSNRLTGSIPAQLENLTNLTNLSLYDNQLGGSIPPELGSLTNLLVLWLYGNQLSGSIPPELGNLTSLRSLFLCWNQLNGSIPPELGNLTNLELLWLGNNQLSGSIPPELGNLTNLELLGLNNNQLSGSIPPELGNLTSLIDLWLHTNPLSGALPRSLMNLNNLREFSFHDTNLCEPSDAAFQAWLAGISNLGIVSYPHLRGQRSVYTFGAKVSPSSTIGVRQCLGGGPKVEESGLVGKGAV